MGKYMKPSNLTENVVYQFELPWSNYNYSAAKPNPRGEGTFSAQWQWEVRFKSATQYGEAGQDGVVPSMSMPAPSSDKGQIEVDEERVMLVATEFLHRQLHALQLNQFAVINIVASKSEGRNGSYMQARVELHEQGAGPPINGNCRTFDGVTQGAPVNCDDPVHVEEMAKQGQGNGTASTPTTQAPVAPTATVQATPVDGAVEVDRMKNDAATIVQAFNAANMAIHHPSVQAILTEHGYSVSAEEFFTFVRGVIAGMDRARFVVTEGDFTFPVPTADDIDFDINRIEAENAAEKGEALLMNEN